MQTIVRTTDKEKIMATKTATKKTAATAADRITAKGNTFTKSWPSAKGQEVVKGDVVRTKSGTTGEVTSRFTMPKKEGRIPYVAVKAKGSSKAVHVPASEVTHAGKTPKTTPAATTAAKVPPSDEVKNEAANVAKRARPHAKAASAGSVIA